MVRSIKLVGIVLRFLRFRKKHPKPRNRHIFFCLFPRGGRVGLCPKRYAKNLTIESSPKFSEGRQKKAEKKKKKTCWRKISKIFRIEITRNPTADDASNTETSSNRARFAQDSPQKKRGKKRNFFDGLPLRDSKFPGRLFLEESLPDFFFASQTPLRRLIRSRTGKRSAA